MLRQVLLLCLVVVTLVRTTESYCSQYKIEECLQPLKTHPYNEGTFFPTKTKSEMTAICGKFYRANDCIRPLLGSCGLVIKKTMEGLVNVYNFICKESINEYLKYRECFSDPTLNVQGKECNTTAQSKLRELAWKKYSMSNSERKSEACGVMDYYVKCVYDLTNGHCGKNAANWMDKVLRKAVGPIMSTTGCGGMMNSKTIVVAIGVGIATLVALTVCVMYMYRRNKRGSGVRYVASPVTTEQNMSYPINQPQYAAYSQGQQAYPQGQQAYPQGQQAYPSSMYYPPQENYPQHGYPPQNYPTQTYPPNQGYAVPQHQPNQEYQTGHQGAPPAYAPAVTGEHTDKTPLTM